MLYKLTKAVWYLNLYNLFQKTSRKLSFPILNELILQDGDEKMPKPKYTTDEVKSILTKGPAVLVEDVTASYGKTIALDKVSALVETGSIYALLGPSGCGKTTLLSCILARKKMDSGAILVNGRLPGEDPSIGFMPQDICLYQEFSIMESFLYFGVLQRMKKDQIKTRLKELTSLLGLPEKDRQVSNMSGGQKRRLSLAVALVHSPRILILDEPTVGLDPIVR